MAVTVVICAHDEAGTIGDVITAASSFPVVVVADDCSDDTAHVARSFGARVVEITAGDKGTAMAVGLSVAGTTDTLFVDADLRGLTTGHVEALAIAPPVGGMVVGIRDDATKVLGASGLPPISGERRVPTDFARSVPLAGMGYRAELAIDAAAARAGLPHRHYKMIGVTNPNRPGRHPLMWADLATFAIVHAGALTDYTFQSVFASR